MSDGPDGEYPNVITPRRLARIKVLILVKEAEDAADRVEFGSDDWVFLKRLAELLEGAAEAIGSVVDPPE